jgi:DNA end-binding protein Ku
MPRSFWKGTISFGLLNIPVTLQTADEGKEIHFSMLDGRDHKKIRFKRVNEKSGKEVPYAKIVKGFEYEKNKFVVISDADIKAANPKATQTIDIQDFVALAEIDPLFFDRPYYIVPQKQGEKGYFLLRDALAKQDKVAVSKVVLRTKQHLAAVMAKGDYLVLELLRFAHEVLTVDEVDYLKGIDTKGKYTPKEMKMAESLMKDMSAKWDPDQYNDTYYKDLMKRIKAKVKAGEGEELEVEAEEAPVPSNMVDLLPLLKKSLEGKKKRRTKAS